MQYLIDKKFQFIRETGTLLYGWCVREDSVHKPVDLIPYRYSIFFTATSIHVNYNSDIGKRKPAVSKVISADLRSGSPFTDLLRHGKPWLSMFGTSRAVKHIELKIVRNFEGDEEMCTAYAGIGYVGREAIQDTETDFMEFRAYVSAERFDGMEKLILSGSPIRLFFSFRKAEGFYSEWSPDPDFEYLKILSDQKPHEQPAPGEGEQKFPVIGKIEEFSISLTVRGECMDPVMPSANEDR